MNDDDVAQPNLPPAEAPVPIPPMRVQRMGKKWRIVYDETRNLARRLSGQPVDNGGFDDETEAQIALSTITSSGPRLDPEEENIC